MSVVGMLRKKCFFKIFMNSILTRCTFSVFEAEESNRCGNKIVLSLQPHLSALWIEGHYILSTFLCILLQFMEEGSLFKPQMEYDALACCCAVGQFVLTEFN